MAKKKVTHPLHMHVPTKIGFTIVGITVMVYGLFLAAGYAANTQTIESNASTKKPVPTPTPINCHTVFHGTCYNIYQHRCSSGYRPGYCPGASNIQCCP